ncbi:apolipoprotein N-acyltransferase [Halodesulfurarchaeum formicicum]|uniref:Apolipoprotein N-acyltransferase n=1 Tax=Halodesulfurarchaeum formicicum TaxID=1873524 RepID=A0A1D8S4M2_9EURY|nr:carbon-nitrogen family hydrolase [Halodesulfurarchaeum formicicum]AOW80303.1 apolipoprotein N-acyltransferase [Halodesulfurarchaeum formicicum]APE95606.1 apolipoprotein N-acyltransferase [Halodesulfurarchaeum formicicum]
MKFGALQIEVKGGDPTGNLERAERAIETAVDRGADLLSLPELWSVGYFATEAYERLAEPLSGPTLDRIGTLADRHDVAIVAGSIIEDLEQTAGETPAESGLANTAVLFDESGARQAIYRKHHLFGYESREQELLTPGDSLGIAEIGGLTVGLTTCYDLRFPELYRRLQEEGVTLVVVPSAWPYPRIEHWTTLTRARAVENLTYLAGVNGVGRAGGQALIGRSRVIGPWGTIRGSAGTEPDTLLVDLNPKRVQTVRDRFPALEDRRDM